MAKASRGAEIEAYFIQTGKLPGPKALMRRMPTNASSVQSVPRRGEQDAFGKQLSHDPSRTRSKRSANGHLAPRRRCAQREACDVARDEEHAKHGAPSIHNAIAMGPTM